MAEAIARRAIESGLLGDDDVFVASAGVTAPDGLPVNAEALDALARVGIEHRGTSKRLTADMIRNADVVFAMTASHVEAARDLVRGEPAELRVVALDPDLDIEDPIGLGPAVYDVVAARLEQLVPRRLAEVLST